MASMTLRRFPRFPDRLGFSLIELMVVVTIIILLISILMPAMGRAREIARRAMCGSNLHQLNNAANTYRTANRVYPWVYHCGNLVTYPSFFRDGIWMPYLQERKTYGCPSGRNGDAGIRIATSTWDGNWPDNKVGQGYFYVGTLPANNWAGNNEWGSTVERQVANAAGVARGRNASASTLLVTEGVQGFEDGGGFPNYVYYAHGAHSKYTQGPWTDPLYNGVFQMVGAGQLSGVEGFNRGYADGHVTWNGNVSECNTGVKMWTTNFTYSHWVWTRWYW